MAKYETFLKAISTMRGMYLMGMDINCKKLFYWRPLTAAESEIPELSGIYELNEAI